MKDIQEIIRESKNIVVTTHKSPDGDAVGSSLALSFFLQKIGKNATVITPDNFPDFLKWMPRINDVVIYNEQQKKVQEAINDADLVFCLDYNDLNRIGNLKDELLDNPVTKIVIDHHQEPTDFADKYFVDVNACSTAQLVYEFLEQLNELDKLDKATAECLYVGIMTDTGSFKFPSTSAKTHRIIAHLIELGVNNSKIHENVYDNYSEHRLRLMGYSLTSKLKIFKEYNTAVIGLTQKELDEYSYQTGDTEGLVNYPLSIKEIKFSILVTEKNGLVKMSFRSQGNFPANIFAKNHFNGGGHINAAGGISNCSVEETISLIESYLPKYNDLLV